MRLLFFITLCVPIVCGYLQVPSDFCSGGSSTSQHKPNGYYCCVGYSVSCIDGIIVNSLLCPRGCDTISGGCNPVHYCELVISLPSNSYCSPYVNYSIDYLVNTSSIDRTAVIMSNGSNECVENNRRAVCLSLYLDCDDRAMNRCNEALTDLKHCRNNTETNITCSWSVATSLRHYSIMIVISLVTIAYGRSDTIK